MTPDTKALSELVERVEKAEGPDRSLDLAIFKALGLIDPRAVKGGVTGFGYVDRGQWACAYIPPLTDSLDAALALVERVLPGQWIELSGPRKYLHIPTPVPNRWRAECGAVGWGATPALALLAAMLRALSSLSPELAGTNDHG